MNDFENLDAGYIPENTDRSNDSFSETTLARALEEKDRLQKRIGELEDLMGGDGSGPNNIAGWQAELVQKKKLLKIAKTTIEDLEKHLNNKK